MIVFQATGYKRACAPITGGIAAMFVADADDFNFTPGAADASGNATGYSAMARVTGAGSGATATATVPAAGAAGAGTVTGTNVTAGGTGYTTAPNVQFTGGGGTGAAGFANLSGGVVISITITVPGSGYTTAPTVSFITGATAAGGAYLYEITSQADSLSVDIDQSNTDGSPSYAYTFAARLAQMSQTLTNFNVKIDGAAACGQLLVVWITNDNKVFVAGERYVASLKVFGFKIRQDGSKLQSGKKFAEFNGQDLALKGTYGRPPFEFSGGNAGLSTFIAP